ncbi:hypothetical protein GE21DRAFT_1071653 [Neurospora crassa]|nr:hypothetical protein GE21DRAFT_1071653 [Neurospora crassa]
MCSGGWGTMLPDQLKREGSPLVVAGRYRRTVLGTNTVDQSQVVNKVTAAVGARSPLFLPKAKLGNFQQTHVGQQMLSCVTARAIRSRFLLATSLFLSYRLSGPLSLSLPTRGFPSSSSLLKVVASRHQHDLHPKVCTTANPRILGSHDTPGSNTWNY